VLIGIASLLTDTKNPLVELGLSIASITYGGMLGIFIQGIVFEKFSDRAAIAGVMISISAVLFISVACNVFWPWFVPIGFVISFLTGSILNLLIKK
jgi:NO-binding membrane sensor protein with MHYT domain